MKKDQALKHWATLEPDQNPLKYMQAIQQKTEGSRYGCCGIRIDGNPKFIDAVLSRLQSLIDGENHVTRLELARQPVKVQPNRKAGKNADLGAEVCYIRLHIRGAQGAAASAFFDKGLRGPTERYARTIGVPVDAIG